MVVEVLQCIEVVVEVVEPVEGYVNSEVGLVVASGRVSLAFHVNCRSRQRVACGHQEFVGKMVELQAQIALMLVVGLEVEEGAQAEISVLLVVLLVLQVREEASLPEICLRW